LRRYHILSLIILGGLALYFPFGYIPARASLLYGPPGASLSISERIEYSSKLLVHGNKLTTPLSESGLHQRFRIEPGESVLSISNRLMVSGLIVNDQAMYDYLVYSGLDRSLQAGEFLLRSSMSIIDIAHELQDSTPQDLTFVILPGWRMEEIAASLPTSGLEITPEEFLEAANRPPAVLDFIPGGATMEGFFLPNTYILPRDSSVEQVLERIGRGFTQHLTEDLRQGFNARNLTVYQGVILASIVEREAVRLEEQSQIASVFINRLSAGMSLGSDPTVQYAIGYDPGQGTWWKNPLEARDLKIDSPYNTYVVLGLPPGPIANPGLDALRSVAYPLESPFYYFRAKCDNSGYHVFSVTLEEHLANACP